MILDDKRKEKKKKRFRGKRALLHVYIYIYIYMSSTHIVTPHIYNPTPVPSKERKGIKAKERYGVKTRQDIDGDDDVINRKEIKKQVASVASRQSQNTLAHK